MFKIGEIYEVSEAMNGGGFSEFAVVEVVSQERNPLCKLLSGKCEYNHAPGNEPGAWIDGKFLRPLTLMAGDYVACADIATDAEYDAVRAAFIAAGAEISAYDYALGAESRGDWKYFGWNVPQNCIDRWNAGCVLVGANRLMTPALVLSTVRAPEAKEWDGVGLPPVGTKCEYAGFGGRIERGVITCHVTLGDKSIMAFIQYPEGGYDCSADVKKFRPVRTEEHRLAEQLQSDAGLKPKDAARVIAAGYRKAVVS